MGKGLVIAGVVAVAGIGVVSANFDKLRSWTQKKMNPQETCIAWYEAQDAKCKKCGMLSQNTWCQPDLLQRSRNQCAVAIEVKDPDLFFGKCLPWLRKNQCVVSTVEEQMLEKACADEAFSMFLHESNANADNTEYYKHVDEVMLNPVDWREKRLQVHGRVVSGSIMRRMNGNLPEYKFNIQTNGREMVAHYTGIVPDTFKDASEVVCKGRLNDQSVLEVFPDGVMTKCPSEYVAKAKAASTDHDGASSVADTQTVQHHPAGNGHRFGDPIYLPNNIPADVSRKCKKQEQTGMSFAECVDLLTPREGQGAETDTASSSASGVPLAASDLRRALEAARKLAAHGGHDDAPPSSDT